MAWKGTERRRAPRVFCGAAAKVFGTRTVGGRVKDLSRGGLLFQMAPPLLPVGVEVEIRIQLPGGPCEATGEIRYHADLSPEDGGPGVGLRFVRLPRESEQAIGRFIDERSREGSGR